jgi:gliding motility-associated-like protein
MLSGKVQGKLNIARKIGLTAGLGIFLSIFMVNAALAASYATLTFRVIMDLNPPVIQHKPLKLVNVIGNKIVIKADISDDSGLASVVLFYKKHSDTNYSLVANAVDKNKKNYELKVAIPPEVITTDGVDYYITATDIAGGIGIFSNAGYSQAIPSPVIPITVEIKPYNVTATISADGGAISMQDGNPEDGTTSLIVPPDALPGSTDISMSQVSDLSLLPKGNGSTWTRQPVAAYQLTPEELALSGAATLSMLYFDLDKDGVVDGTNIKVADLRIFRWDGFDWRYVDGTVDQLNNIVTGQINRLGTYALFPARSLSANDYRPKQKIITPATADGINDKAEFDGLQGKKVTINIFDVTGKKVRTISNEPYEWNGRDDEERLVESGVYIYQFEVDNQMISGMIAVAK